MGYIETSFCMSPNSNCFFHTCSPKAFGQKSYACGINDLSEKGAIGKKTTQPCPCGISGDDSERCNCSAEQIQR